MDMLLSWAIVFLIVALVSGFFGFYNVSHAAVTVAKALCVIFIVLFIVAILVSYGYLNFSR